MLCSLYSLSFLFLIPLLPSYKSQISYPTTVLLWGTEKGGGLNYWCQWSHHDQETINTWQGFVLFPVLNTFLFRVKLGIRKKCFDRCWDAVNLHFSYSEGAEVMTILILPPRCFHPLKNCQIHHSWERARWEQSKENFSGWKWWRVGASFHPGETSRLSACSHTLSLVEF